jgi:hypothetical protein
VKPH